MNHFLKKVACTLMMGASMSLMMLPFGANASAAAIPTGVHVSTYDPEVDYFRKMLDAAKDGSTYALQMGAIYEAQRNLKIDSMNLRGCMKTNFFVEYGDGGKIAAAIEEVNRPKKSYTEEDLYWLSRLIYAEAGYDHFPDWVQRYVAYVCLNRVNSAYYPNTIKEVIFDTHWAPQYGCAWDGNIYKTPSQKAIDNAKFALEHGSQIPAGVMGQSGSCDGRYYASYENIYFFYVG